MAQTTQNVTSISQNTSAPNFAELGRRTGMSRFQISRIMAGERSPSWDAACRLADAMGMTMDQLRDLLPQPQLQLQPEATMQDQRAA